MRTTQSKNRLVWPLSALSLIAAYFLFLRSLLGTAIAAQIELFALGWLVMVISGTILVGLFTLVELVFVQNRAGRLKKLAGQMLFVLILLALLASIVLGSQWTAHTPAIPGADGQPQPGSWTA